MTSSVRYGVRLVIAKTTLVAVYYATNVTDR